MLRGTEKTAGPVDGFYSNTFPVPVEPVKDNILTRSLPRTVFVTSSTLSREQEIVFITPDGMPASSAN